MKKTWIALLAGTLSVAVIGLALFAYVRSQAAASHPAGSIARGEYDPPRTIGDLALTDQDGRTVKLSDLRGRPAWLFFGYTNCPDVCPLTMGKMKAVKARLGDAADRVAFVFISVDGARDTPNVVKRFVRKFDPAFIGLTGAEAHVRQIATQFSTMFDAPASQAHATGDVSYMVNHTSYSYLLDRQGRWRFVYLPDTPLETIVEDISQVLNN